MRPVALHAPRQKHRLVGLLEQEVLLDQGFLLFFSDASGLRSIGGGAMQRVVVTLEVALEVCQCLHDDGLELVALLLADGWSQKEARDRATSAHTSRDDVVVIDVVVRYEATAIEVGWRMRQLGVVVASKHHRMHQLLEEIGTLGITKHEAHFASVPVGTQL